MHPNDRTSGPPLAEPDDPPVSSHAIGDPPYWQEPYLDENGYRAWLTRAMMMEPGDEAG